MSLTSGQHAEGPLVVRPTPGRTFWLLCSVVALAVVVLIGLNNCGTLESGCL